MSYSRGGRGGSGGGGGGGRGRGWYYKEKYGRKRGGAGGRGGGGANSSDRFVDHEAPSSSATRTVHRENIEEAEQVNSTSGIESRDGGPPVEKKSRSDNNYDNKCTQNTSHHFIQANVYSKYISI